MAFSTHTERPPLGIGSGGPKKHCASGAQLPGDATSHCASEVQGAPVFTSVMQCLVGASPRVQLPGPVPALALSVPGPLMVKSEVAASGILLAGTVTAAPPPM